jgi:ubiquinol-cytochrome c reductase iron-sulfur subunit
MSTPIDPNDPGRRSDQPGGEPPGDQPPAEHFELADSRSQPTPTADAHAGRFKAAHEGTVAVIEGDPFADPGLPHHEPRRTDIDERAARRAERQVVTMFGLSTLSTLAFLVCFVLIDKDTMITVFPLGKINALNFALGMTLGISLLLIGAGAIQWSRKLMAGEELVEARHLQKSSPETTASALGQWREVVADSALPRRKLIGLSLLGALAPLGLPALFVLRDLGPLPEKKLRVTAWRDHREIVFENGGERVRPEDLQVGTLISARPMDVESLNELAKAAIILIRLAPDEVRSQFQLQQGYEGIMAFSKICPHVGCPLGLYEQTTHHMLCPCHQSTFDLADEGKVVFGPAARNLPLLPITVDAEGYLVARGDFPEPVGPSFWERGRVGPSFRER